MYNSRQKIWALRGRLQNLDSGILQKKCLDSHFESLEVLAVTSSQTGTFLYIMISDKLHSITLPLPCFTVVASSQSEIKRSHCKDLVPGWFLSLLLLWYHFFLTSFWAELLSQLPTRAWGWTGSHCWWCCWRGCSCGGPVHSPQQCWSGSPSLCLWCCEGCRLRGPKSWTRQKTKQFALEDLRTTTPKAFFLSLRCSSLKTSRLLFVDVDAHVEPGL